MISCPRDSRKDNLMFCSSKKIKSEVNIMREFFKTKKDIEERIRNNVKNIAFYADNLTKEDCILVDLFLKSADKKYGVNYHICEVRNTLHNNTDFYKSYMPKNNWTGWISVELTNLLLCDEVWIFDNGYDNYKLNGRLDNVIKSLKKPVKFLAKTSDGKSWDFYKGRDMVRNANDELQENYYYIVEEYDFVPDNERQNSNNQLRPISKTTLSEKEYELAFSALELTQFMGKLSIKASVRNDNELLNKINPFLKTGNEILMDILSCNSCDEETLKLCQAKLDFAAPDVEKLINDYDL